MDDLLSLDVALIDGRLVIAAAGEVDGEIWLDLVGLEFIDSSGLTAVLRLKAVRDGSFAVICPAGPIRRVFEVAGVVHALPIYASREEAVADRR